MKKKHILLFSLLTFLLINCNLFNPPDDDYWEKIEEEIAYANAPWVPMRIETGGIGTASLFGNQNQTVKKGYSFTLVFQPSADYPFFGWQAWYGDNEPFAFWQRPETEEQPAAVKGETQVKFAPKTIDGTEVEIFVYEMPPEGQLLIGPLGATAGLLDIRLEVAPAEGTSNPPPGLLVNPQPRLGLWFTLHYTPSADYHFIEWEAVDENGLPVGNADVVFEPPDSVQTRVMVMTTEPLRLRPRTAERPLIVATNVVWGTPVVTNFPLRVRFSRAMDQASINWDTVSIVGTNPSWGRTEYDSSSFADMVLADEGRQLTLLPIGGFVRPNSSVTVTFKRLKADGSTGVCSADDIPLARDLVVEYETGYLPKVSKPTYAENVKVGVNNGGVWTVWQDSTYDANSANRVPPTGNRVLSIAFVEDAINSDEITAVRITETWTRNPDGQLGGEIIYPPVEIPISQAFRAPNLMSVFGFSNPPYVVPYELQTPHSWNSITTTGFHEVGLKVELFDGVNWSDPAASDTWQRPQEIRSRLEPLPNPDALLVPVQGAALTAGSWLASMIRLYSFTVDNNNIPLQPNTSPLSSLFSGLASYSVTITIPDFRMGETELTEFVWHEVHNWALSNGYTFTTTGSTKGDNYPVTNVSWQNAIIWCNAASEFYGLTPAYQVNGVPLRTVTALTGLTDNQYEALGRAALASNGIRLPTEFEWEYAARGGKVAPQGTWLLNYAGSNTADDVAWYTANSGNSSQPVKGKAANRLSLFDMSGNVAELCWNISSSINMLHAVNYLSDPMGTNASTISRVMKGGQYNSQTTAIRPGDRNGLEPNDSSANYAGFRIMRTDL